MYDYIIIGAGVAGSTLAFELSKYNSNILLIDKNDDVSKGASGAAGAFLSPLLGKPNNFKDLVNKALVYSSDFYKTVTPKYINNCGTIRIPKDEIDRKKFESYKPYIDFEYKPMEEGFYFPIASVVNGYEICKLLTKEIKKLFNYEVKSICFKDGNWILDDTLESKNLIITSGFCTKLIDELYFNIRPVWGQRIDIKTSTCIDLNYHKECSLAQSKQINENTYISSIGATHHRDVSYKKTNKNDTTQLIKKAKNILDLKDIEVTKEYGGARASSVDYFPMIGELINSKKTLEAFPYLKHGTHVQKERFIRYENLYVINGLGGRGFVLAPYLAKMLCDKLENKKPILSDIEVDRLFLRWVKKQ